LGMLADAVRRRRHGTRATYVRVASVAVGDASEWNVPPAAREIRITGAPASFGQALGAVERVRTSGRQATVSGFSWHDIEQFAQQEGQPLSVVLRRLRAEGLDALAALPLDTIGDAAAAIDCLQQAGFSHLCLGVESVGTDRREMWWQAGELQDRFGCIQALNPLPTSLRSFRPTTGYDDVKTVAAARLATPGIPSIQVDWQRYGPKLAQVALTFGADDVWGIAASDEAPEGRRRAPVEEIRRNIEAAGFDPLERDGRFLVPS
jgi:aminodeoxyfutalosine synthase